MKRRTLTAAVILAILLAAPEAQPRSDEAIKRNNFGAELLKQERLEEAVTEFQRAVELDAGYTAARLNLGYLYDRLERVEEAMTEYRKVIELDPGNLLARNNLGVLYNSKGLYEDAIGEFEEVLRINPSDAAAQKNLEIARKNSGIVQEREERIARARKAVEANPTNPRASYDLARIYASFDEKEQALEWLTRALGLGFNDFGMMKSDPALATLGSDPRFTRLLQGR